MHTRTCLRSAVLLLLLVIAPLSAQTPSNVPANLTEGTELHGFRADALYLGDGDAPIGARFIHIGTGFTFDMIRSQSVPQSFVWVNSYPTSDMGEPHTQEHLLLGKGNKGRYVANLEDMSLTQSSAFTMQWRTCYHSHTSAGPDVYFHILHMQLDALLNPDYTDEEIRREVANFGVDRNPDGTLRLEEKGTVYNEMVSAFQGGWTRMGRALDRTLYGDDHPLAQVSGGLPAAIREMKPEDIRRFHRENYKLGNMGMVGSYPNEMETGDILIAMDSILNALEPLGNRGKRQDFRSAKDLPTPKSAPRGTFVAAEYPQQNPDQPGPVLLAWPPVLDLDLVDGMLLDLFLENIAGDPSTNLYKTFIDSRTRTIEVGATSVFAWRSSDQGNPIMIGLGNVNPASMTRERIREIRGGIDAELKRIASWQAGSPELKAFNERLANRITEQRRANSKFVNSPPGFGFRGTGASWMEQLRTLERSGTFRRSVTLEPQLDRISEMLREPRNIWTAKLRTTWKMIGTEPYAAAALPNPELIAEEAAEKDARIAAETARLRKLYGLENDQEALRRYQEEYDRKTLELDSIAALVETPAFMENPPLTLDGQLDYHVTSLSGDVPMVVSTFENMTGGTVGMAFRLDGVAQEDLPWLSLMPSLIRDVGVIDDGIPITNEEMNDRLRQEILNLSAYFSTNFATGRAELVVRGSGNDPEETEQAVKWMERILFAPYWKEENLGRMRDVVDRELSDLRNTMGRREESWVNDPAAAYWRQESPLLQTTASFLARTHNALRLRWLLKDAGEKVERRTIASFLGSILDVADNLEQGPDGRADLFAMLDGILADAPPASDASSYATEGMAAVVQAAHDLPPATRALAIDAARDLKLTLSDIPDETLAGDVRYLVSRIMSDLLVRPGDALATLNRIRERILRTGGARAFIIGSTSTIEKQAAPVLALVDRLEMRPVEPTLYQGKRSIDERMMKRHGGRSARPVYVGLVNPNLNSGVFLNSAEATSYTDTDRESLLNFLSSMLYSGGGAHTIFMKTWGAGLAYSNGIRISPNSGRINYYAERCPALPQTLKFVIGELENAPNDPALVEYAIAQAFGASRAASSYESRGESMASDLADGLTPENVAAFRQAILELRSEPQLADELHGRLAPVCGTVLPGYGPSSENVPGAVYMVIGPEKQMELYEEYLKSIEGEKAKLYRLFPRDFWMGR